MFNGSIVRGFTALAFCCLLAATFPRQKVNAQSATNYVAVDSVKVGDTFNYSIVTHYPSSYEKIKFPDTSHFGSSVTIVNQKRFKLNERTDSLSYTLQFFGTQSHTIPKLPVRFIADSDTSTLYVPPVPLDFKTTLQSKNESLLPLKPIFDFALNWWPYLIGLIILALAGYLLYRWYQRRETDEQQEEPTFTPQPFLDPLQELKKNLRQIKQNRQLDDHQAFKTFYSHLGDALRWYLERVYEIPALESTTGELLRDLHHEAAPEALIQKTKSILQEADMVKFARFSPTYKQANNALNEAEAFLDIAQRKDRQRIEYLRSRHEDTQQQLQKIHNANNKTSITTYD